MSNNIGFNHGDTDRDIRYVPVVETIGYVLQLMNLFRITFNK